MTIKIASYDIHQAPYLHSSIAVHLLVLLFFFHLCSIAAPMHRHSGVEPPFLFSLYIASLLCLVPQLFSFTLTHICLI